VRTAIISDIHANLEALEAVRAKLCDLKPDRVICLGDVVGYGADPEECVRIVMDEGWPTLLGNHDAAIIDPDEMAPMNPMARAALEWTASILSEKSKKFLASLPYTASLTPRAIASHALPHKPDAWLYSDDAYAVVASFTNMSEDILFVGHLHFAHAYKLVADEGKLFLMQTPECVDMISDRHLINVGSVGQPRDEDHRACLVVFDDVSRNAIYHRVQYDTAKAAKKIVDAGLPEALAQRLFLGR